MEINLVPISNNDMVRYLLNLIRYDIPILMAGKSSIGKSYTILSLAEKWGMPNAVLYVGSEKADNIEGLPKLIDEQSEKKENVLTYYKPYWYPKSRLIQDAVKRGYVVFNNKIQNNFANPSSNSLPFKTVMGLLFSIRGMKFPSNSTTGVFNFVDNSGYITDTPNVICNGGIELQREIVPLGAEPLEYTNELYDLSLFLSTLVGLGNYWLILDELDKVQEEEADKFAPMLHIVRERRLKTYNMREINDGKGTDVSMNVRSDSYVPIYEMIKDAIDNNKSVLDTRIIAISNKTNNIIDISDALFKRFVQVIIGDVLVLDNVEQKLADIRACLSKLETKIGGQQGDLEVGKLQEINLQWQFGFLPRILNNRDTEGNFIRKNYLEKVSSALTIADDDARKTRIEELGKGTVLYKLCQDNFDAGMSVKDADNNEEYIPDAVMSCLASQFSLFKEQKVESTNPLDIIKDIQNQGFTDDKDIAMEVYNHLINKYKLVPQNGRYIEMENLIKYAYDFIRYTAYADGFSEDKITKNVKYNPLSVNEYLIPVVIKFILKAITKDEMLSFEDKDRLMSEHAKLWSDFTLPDYIETLKGNPDLTKDLFYGGEDSLWGSADLNADDFQSSFVNSFNTANIELFEDFIKEYMQMTDAKQEEFKDFIDYIKKYRASDIKAIKDRQKEGLLKAKKAQEVTQLVKKYKQLFDV